MVEIIYYSLFVTNKRVAKGKAEHKTWHRRKSSRILISRTCACNSRSTTQHLLALVCTRCPFLAHFPTSKFVGNDDHQHNTRVWWTIRLWFKNWWPQLTPIISSITHVQGPYFLTGTRWACSSWDVSVSAWYIFLAYFLSSLDFWDIGMNRWLQSIRFLKYSQRRRSELCDVIIFQIRHPNLRVFKRL